MTWFPLPSLWRFWLGIVHSFLGHPIDDRRQNNTIHPIIWCASCGAALEKDDRP